LLRHLVHRAGREDVAGAEDAQQRARVEHEREEVGRRVAEVDRDRVASAGADDGRKPAVDLGEGLAPADPFPGGAATDHGLAKAVGIVVQVLQGRSLGAQVAAAERVGLVAPDAEDLPAAGPDLEPAGGLAQGAGTIVRRDRVHGTALYAGSRRMTTDLEALPALR